MNITDEKLENWLRDAKAATEDGVEFGIYTAVKRRHPSQVVAVLEELKELRRVNATYQSAIEQARYRMGSAYGKTHPFTMELRLANSLMEPLK